MGPVDPITRQIIQSALASGADEMAVGLHRTARSTIVRDVLDFSTSICDADGQQIAQGVTLALHMGSVPYAMVTLLAKFEDQIHPGDIFILNDPFDGGMHLPDIFIVQPIFVGEQRVAFAVATAHHLDVGGRLPGSSACDNVEIFQDGLRIPWLKLADRGKPDEAILALIRVNVRVPDMTLSDLQAQLAACHIGHKAVLEIVDRYGLDTFSQCTRDLIDYTERLVRADIAGWPDGLSTFTDYMDGNGCPDSPGPVKITCTIKVEGDSLTADFTGTDAQVRGAINSTLSMTASCVAACVRSMIREQVPNTSGIFRPLTIIAPDGTSRTLTAELDPRTRTAIAEYRGTDQIGLYRVEADTRFTHAGAFAVNLDRAESNLDRAHTDEIREAFGDVPIRVLSQSSAARAPFPAPTDTPPLEHKEVRYWPWLLLAAMLAFTLETLLANLFTRRRPSGEQHGTTYVARREGAGSVISDQ